MKEIASKTKEDEKKEKRRILKNICLISVAFLFNFNAFQGLSRLQSSLHLQEGLGVITSSVIYISLTLSCLFLPKPLITFLGYKWTMTLSFSGYILYLVANGYAVWWTMVTASLLIGLCAAPLWTAQCSYFTKIGGRYAELSHEKADAVVARFFGIFFTFMQFSSISGSVISSVVLRENQTTPQPDTVGMVEYCGASDCPSNNVSNPHLEKPESSTVWTLVGIYIAIACAGVVILAMFVDELPDHLKEKRVGVGKEVVKLATSTVRHCTTNVKQIILIPISMYVGLEQTFFTADFSKSFVACNLGIWKIGLVIIPFGVVCCIVSLTSGYIVKYTGRVPIFIAGAVMDLCIQFTLLFWVPRPEEEYVLYILAAMLGFTDAIWQTQIAAMYGAVFSKTPDTAFSAYRLWSSIGFTVAFAYSSFLCTYVKLYILTSVLIAGAVGLMAVEWRVRVEQRSGNRMAALRIQSAQLLIDNRAESSLEN